MNCPTKSLETLSFVLILKKKKYTLPNWNEIIEQRPKYEKKDKKSSKLIFCHFWFYTIHKEYRAKF